MDEVKNIILHFFSASGWLSSIYYAFNSNAFRREHRSVILGRLKYFSPLSQVNQTNFSFRRNIHRLEKGLMSRPFRKVFGLSYIEETVRQFESLNRMDHEQIVDISELSWGFSILRRYFDSVGDNPTIERAKLRFDSIPLKDGLDTDMIPYPRKTLGGESMSYEALYALSLRRRAVRWYLQKEVPRSEIDRALEVAALSPSACNRQPFEFLIFDHRDTILKISSLVGGARGFRENIPMLLVILGKLRAYHSERDRHLIYIDSSLAAMSLMLALETLGLSSCALNWPDIPSNEKKIASFLVLEPDERVIMLMAIGYPDPEGLIAYSQKKPLDVLRTYNPI